MGDPFALPALTIGAASLAIQVFSGIKKGYARFLSAIQMDEECGVLRINLAIQFSKILDWGDAAGLTDPEKHNEYDRKLKYNKALIFGVLSEIQSILKALKEVSLRYDSIGAEGPKDPAQRIPVESGEEPTNILNKFRTKSVIEDIDLERFAHVLRSQDIPPERRSYPRGFNTLVKVAQGIQDISKQPKRLRWALIDRDGAMRHVERLTELTDFLHTTLGDTQMEILLETTRETWLAMLQLTTTVQGMENLLEAMQKPRAQSTDSRTSFDSQGTTLVARESSGGTEALHTGPESLLQRLTRFSIIVAKSQKDQSSTKFESKHLALEDIQALELGDDEDRGTRTIGALRGKKLWVEWKSFKIMFNDEGNGILRAGPDPRLVRAVERLVALLQTKFKPKEFRLPYCLGYLIRKGKNPAFGLIHTSGDPWPETHELQSLLWVLEKGRKPPIAIRFQLAQDLAACISSLHAVNWLHKGLRSASVLFLKLTANDDSLGNMYLSGLEYARLDESGCPTTGPPLSQDWAVYSHPEYVDGNRFRKSYDIYGLGIVLMEIALWEPAEKLFTAYQPSSLVHETAGSDGNTVSSKQIHEIIFSENDGLLQRVRMNMGSKYYSATKACVEGMSAFGLPDTVDQTDPTIGALLQQAFLRVVVDTLGSIVI
ncbi:hypothetical protein M501DRAFT_932292 [Patellaria atrata CBS 101060]|uniref:Prion-inhibition and propagation HeLo domain-containing protein n=1 Tax=Patellaria atrata CBS 101060 TaxID=1346257 RepID=A0A9P4SF43_9PEZI|nr:hypothetical protein M501DRAFT_932292 [Patellaria atrata CBS 101060]